jgi:hypothetical protein
MPDALDASAPAVPTPVLPAYDGAWTGALVPALLEGDRALLPETVRDADAVVLFVLDGLGWQMLQEHRGLLPNLSAMAGGPVTTAAPSTTSVALTSIATGMPPSRHGIVGYRMRVGGEVLNVLRWPSSDRSPDPGRVQPQPPFGGRPVPVVTKSEFRNSPFTIAHLRGTAFTGWRVVSTLVEHCRMLVAAGEPLVYAYTDGVDKVSHEYGLRDGFLQAELRATDALVGQLLDALPASAALVLTADHGQVHVEPEGHRTLEALEPMVGTMAGEGRFRTLWARPGASGELLAAAMERFGHEAWVRTREEVFADGWLGAEASQEVRGRIGDVVLAAHAPVIFVDRAMPLEIQMKSHHGSLTAAEMLVPLVAARGRA